MNDSLPAILYDNQSSKLATEKAVAVKAIWRESEPTYLQFVEQSITIGIRLNGTV